MVSLVLVIKTLKRILSDGCCPSSGHLRIRQTPAMSPAAEGSCEACLQSAGQNPKHLKEGLGGHRADSRQKPQVTSDRAACTGRGQVSRFEQECSQWNATWPQACRGGSKAPDGKSSAPAGHHLRWWQIRQQEPAGSSGQSGQKTPGRCYPLLWKLLHDSYCCHLSTAGMRSWPEVSAAVCAHPETSAPQDTAWAPGARKSCSPPIRAG